MLTCRQLLLNYIYPALTVHERKSNIRYTHLHAMEECSAPFQGQWCTGTSPANTLKMVDDVHARPHLYVQKARLFWSYLSLGMRCHTAGIREIIFLRRWFLFFFFSFSYALLQRCTSYHLCIRLCADAQRLVSVSSSSTFSFLHPRNWWFFKIRIRYF